MEFFDLMDPVLRGFWYIAIPSSLFFLGQTLLTFFGADATDGIDADFDSNLSGTEAPFQLFSLRNLINFLLGFSWSGIAFYTTIPNNALLLLFATLVGSAFVWLFFIIIKQLQKLAEDNSFKLSNTLNKTAEVYLTIPEHLTGKGKILISVNGSFHELEAVTQQERIASGSIVKVVAIESDNLLRVEKI